MTPGNGVPYQGLNCLWLKPVLTKKQPLSKTRLGVQQSPKQYMNILLIFKEGFWRVFFRRDYLFEREKTRLQFLSQWITSGGPFQTHLTPLKNVKLCSSWELTQVLHIMVPHYIMLIRRLHPWSPKNAKYQRIWKQRIPGDAAIRWKEHRETLHFSLTLPLTHVRSVILPVIMTSIHSSCLLNWRDNMYNMYATADMLTVLPNKRKVFFLAGSGQSKPQA